MGDAFRRHRAHGRHQGLAQRLAAEHALPGLLRAAAAEQVLLERLRGPGWRANCRWRFARLDGSRPACACRPFEAGRVKLAPRRPRHDPLSSAAGQGDRCVQHAERFDVLIAGGGTVGLALACALADALGPAARIAVADPRRSWRGARHWRHSRLGHVGRLQAPACHVSASGRRIADDAQPVTAIDITDSRLDDAFRPVLLSYDNTRRGRRARHLYRRERAAAAGAGWRPRLARPSVTSDWRRSRRRLCRPASSGVVDPRLPPPRLLRAARSSAADGRALAPAAGCRHQIVRWSYPQIGIVTTVRIERPHQGRAVQHFLPSGPFAILPLTGQPLLHHLDRGRRSGARNPGARGGGFLAEVEKRFGYRLGAVVSAGPRAVLAARHASGPRPGGGSLCARRRCGARRASDRRAGSQSGPARRRRADRGDRRCCPARPRHRLLSSSWSATSAGAGSNSALSAATFDALNRLFSNDWTLLRTARDFGLAVLDQLPALKQFFVAEAAGLTGEVPKLLRGERP